MPTHCRSGLHPYSERRTKSDSRTECTSCRTENRQGRAVMGTVEHTGWYDPLIDVERAERLQAWQDGLDAAIAMVRRTEGFDGGERTWQTLGEYLRLPTRHPVQPRRRPITRMVVICPDCATPRLWDAPCATCVQRRAAGVRRVAS